MSEAQESAVPSAPPKRVQVDAACQRCRARKTKCSGARPCRYCSERDLECVYVTEENETRQRAGKRRHEELLEQSQHYAELVELLAGNDQQAALRAFRRVRAGHEPRAIVSDSKDGDDAQMKWRPTHLVAYRQMLLRLSQSTASLQEIVQVALAARDSGTVFRDLIQHAAKDMLISRDALTKCLPLEVTSNIPWPLLEPSAPLSLSNDGSYRGPLYWVPADPWTTTLPVSDYDVSHLVSVYLTVVNPYWRFLEDDVFIRDMRTRDIHSTYCSPLLVAAVLAVGSLYSEIESAFSISDDLPSRGAHFHAMALDLWAKEQDRTSVVNIQASMILLYEASVRGEDRLNGTYMLPAIRMAQELPILEPDSTAGLAISEYVRVRNCCKAALYWLSTLHGHSVNMSLDEWNIRHLDQPSLDNILPDTTAHWTAFPLGGTTYAIRRNLITRERCNLATFDWQLWELSQEKLATADDRQRWQERMASLATAFHKWYSCLPNELNYLAQHAFPLHEFHAQARVVGMGIYERWHSSRTEGLNTGHRSEQSLRDLDSLWHKALQYAYDSACALRDFREEWGWRIAPAMMWHNAFNVVFVLLRDLHRLSSAGDEVDLERHDSMLALEECIRCIVAGGMQHLLPRGIARMVFFTAKQLKIRLPTYLRDIVRVAGDAIWRQSDIDRIQSRYPNKAVQSIGVYPQEKCEMDVILREIRE